ncbi:MAG: glycosyltransferase family 4 protein [Chloroflexi bacterium]|nr:glycosyltransferase family 4 protein [Chloroflexota bacterium]
MRALHVIQRYWPYTGGSERHLQEFAERLVRAGGRSTVFTTDAWDLEAFWAGGKRLIPKRAETHNGVRIRRFPVRRLPGSRLSYPGVRRVMAELSDLPVDARPLLRRLAPLAPLVPELQWTLRRLPARFDVVLGMNICFEGLLLPALSYARRTGAAFVVAPLTHLGEPGNEGIRRYYTMRHQIDLLAQADAVLAQTQLERDFLVDSGVPAARITLAPPGVNPEEVLGGAAERFRAKYAIAGPIVTYVGTTAYDKGTHHLVQAMRRLWRDGVAATLVLAGPTMDQFTRFYERLPEADRARCRVLGFIPEPDKRDLLAACDLLAMPSRTDSFGLVYLEAWLYGKPVIGARAGGVPEVIADGEDGFLVPFGDVDALADRIRRLLENRELADRLGRAGREKTLAHHTWDRTFATLTEVYERVGAKR